MNGFRIVPEERRTNTMPIEPCHWRVSKVWTEQLSTGANTGMDQSIAEQGGNIIVGSMIRLLSSITAISLALGIASPIEANAAESASNATVIVVVGAPGEDEFGNRFNEWASHWEKAAKAGGTKWIPIGYVKGAGTNEGEELTKALGSEAKTGSGELWVVLLGHGTFDGKDSKFN